ncbi:MAG TPA: tricarballylate utilization 4Fe-4S protein TcuB [Casimicrobiaceae bacterium]|nr:tricarballylate utilization 4Fe-4S protein TcuB [Casimicrobiaceae bacterium]
MSTTERPPLFDLIEEAQRVLSICNACRYCEGYCAVFPALQRRLAFNARDVHYLANLCHNCGSCLHACQYAPPHAFQVDFPRLLAQVRKETYRQYAWPRALAGAFEHNGTVVAIASLASVTALLLFTAWYADPARLFTAHSDAAGSFYAVLPHGVMTALFGAVAAFVVVALIAALTRFWKDTGENMGARVRASPVAHATWDASALTYLDGGGDGCTFPRGRPSFARRNFHHLTFYGFTLCFAATVVATVYHYGFGWIAPYPFFSVPVVLGTVGGVALVVGTAGLLSLKLSPNAEVSDASQVGMDVGFLLLLLATSVTGLMLLALRETRAMGVLLALHLGAVLALFLTIPYGKFVHAVYRFAALVRFHVERRVPVAEIRPE